MVQISIKYFRIHIFFTTYFYKICMSLDVNFHFEIYLNLTHFLIQKSFIFTFFILSPLVFNRLGFFPHIILQCRLICAFILTLGKNADGEENHVSQMFVKFMP